MKKYTCTCTSLLLNASRYLTILIFAHTITAMCFKRPRMKLRLIKSLIADKPANSVLGAVCLIKDSYETFKFGSSMVNFTKFNKNIDPVCYSCTTNHIIKSSHRGSKIDLNIMLFLYLLLALQKL